MIRWHSRGFFYPYSRLVLAIFLSTPAAYAATVTWNNTGTDFNSGASWTGSVAPGSADTATFTGAAITNAEILTDTIINNINFSDASAAGYTISSPLGNSLTIVGTGNTALNSAITESNTSGINTVSARIVLGSSTAAASTYTIRQSGTGGVLFVTGDISQTSPNAQSLSVGGATTSSRYVVLGGNNTFTGNFTQGYVTLYIASPTALGAGSTYILSDNGHVNNTSGADLSLSQGVSFRSSTVWNDNTKSAVMGSTTYALTFNGASNLNAASRSVTVTSSTLTLAGGLALGTATAANLTKAGAGTLALAGATTGVGGFTVNAGTLMTTPTGTLGSGAITLSGAVVLTLQNSDSFSDLSTLSLTSSATVNLDFTGNDTLAALSVSGVFIDPGTYTAGQLNEILGVSSFQDLGGLGGTLSIGVVPEPATWAMLLAGIGVLIVFHRRNRNLIN